MVYRRVNLGIGKLDPRVVSGRREQPACVARSFKEHAKGGDADVCVLPGCSVRSPVEVGIAGRIRKPKEVRRIV
jgi:hypothetical protein